MSEVKKKKKEKTVMGTENEVTLLYLNLYTRDTEAKKCVKQL